MQVREKVAKSRNTMFSMFFQWFVAPEGRKVGSLKRRVRRRLGRWEMKNCTPLRREAHVEIKMHKAPQLWSTFRSWDVEKVHAVVARSAFASQNVQNTPCSDHIWKLRCRRSARRCGAKRGSWDVEKVHAVVARSTFRTQNVQSTPCSDHIWKLRCRRSARLLWRETHFQVNMSKKCTFSDHFWTFSMSFRVAGKSDCKTWVQPRNTFGSWDVQKCTLLWRETHFQVNMLKTPHFRTTFGRSDVVSRSRRKWLQNVSF